MTKFADEGAIQALITKVKNGLSGKAASSHSHGNITNTGTVAEADSPHFSTEQLITRGTDGKIKSVLTTIKDVDDAVFNMHSHSSLTLSTTAQTYDGTKGHTLKLPASDPYTSARTPSSHTHGNIQNGGTLQTSDITIASGDKLVVTDASDSNKVARTSLDFDGSSTHKALTKKGTFETVILRVKEITYSELVSKRSQSGLIRGQWYQITDYVTTTAQQNTQSAGHQFDILVQAVDYNRLSEIARARLHTGDTYFANSKLEAWELKYCLDNDTSRFAWADSTNGKGVIWWMKDEFGNECPYDFKNIQFKWTSAISQSGIAANVFYYTFSVALDNDAIVTDHSLNGNSCYGNKMGVYITSNKKTLNKNVFRNTSLISSCYSNTFGNRCYSNTFGYGCNGNIFGFNCFSNTFGYGCSYNTFVNRCYSNTFGYNCYSNTFGYECYSNTFGNTCRSNTFWYDCSHNTFGDKCEYNTYNTHIFGKRFENDKENVFFGGHKIYQTKDYQIYPVSHPDLSTQPSILPQRFGNLDIMEVLISNGSEGEIPSNAKIIEAFSFNDDACVPAVCEKTDGAWSISNQAGITPDFTLIRYVAPQSSPSYS